MKIGIIMGSIRDGRINEPISNWVKEVADNYAIDAEFEIVDLKDYPLPLFDEPASPAYTSDLKAKEQQQAGGGTTPKDESRYFKLKNHLQQIFSNVSILVIYKSI